MAGKVCGDSQDLKSSGSMVIKMCLKDILKFTKSIFVKMLVYILLHRFQPMGDLVEAILFVVPGDSWERPKYQSENCRK